MVLLLCSDCASLLAPFAHRDRGPSADLGTDRKLVHQTSAPAEAEAETAIRGETVFESALDIGDAGTDIARDDPHADGVLLADQRHDDLATPREPHNVAS